MTHLKRQKMPKTWPLKRKGKKYLVSCANKNTIPAAIFFRDVMGIGKTKKEIKKIVHDKMIKLNNKILIDEKAAIGLFDVFEINGKKFRLVIKNKKFCPEETNETKKIAKIIGKKILKGNKIQINLSDGRNCLLKEKASVNDSLIVDLDKKKIEVLPFKEKNEAIFLSGKHLGETGKIESIGKNVVININGEKINATKKNLMIIKHLS